MVYFIVSINHFDISMSRSLLPENDSNNIVNYSEKRNRKPSKFAEGINELKRVKSFIISKRSQKIYAKRKICIITISNHNSQEFNNLMIQMRCFVFYQQVKSSNYQS